jgi:site-specific DNA recombinase
LRDWITLDELRLEIHLVKEGVVLSPESRSHENFMHGIKFTWPRIARIGQHVPAALIPTALNNAWRYLHEA